MRRPCGSLLLCTSTSDPILEVVKEMRSFPITISRSYRPHSIRLRPVVVIFLHYLKQENKNPSPNDKDREKKKQRNPRSGIEWKEGWNRNLERTKKKRETLDVVSNGKRDRIETSLSEMILWKSLRTTEVMKTSFQIMVSFL